MVAPRQVQRPAAMTRPNARPTFPSTTCVDEKHYTGQQATRLLANKTLNVSALYEHLIQ